MVYSVAVYECAPQPIVSIRERRPVGEISEFIGMTFGTLFGRLAELGLEPTGEPFVMYHEFGSDSMDVEVCVPVPGVLHGASGVTSREMPAMTVARTIHVGPYDGLHAAYEALDAWAQAHGLPPAGPLRERYLNSPAEGVLPSAYRTEVEMPVARALNPSTASTAI